MKLKMNLFFWIGRRKFDCLCSEITKVSLRDETFSSKNKTLRWHYAFKCPYFDVSVTVSTVAHMDIENNAEI